jgi:hypothetical protein
VSAIFPGGVEIPEGADNGDHWWQPGGAGAAVAATTVRWVRKSDGSMTAFLSSLPSNSAHPIPANPQRQLLLMATQPALTGVAAGILSQVSEDGRTGGSAVYAEAQDAGQGAGAKIIDSVGSSDFQRNVSVNAPTTTDSILRHTETTSVYVQNVSLVNMAVHNPFRFVTGFITADGYSASANACGFYASLAGVPIVPTRNFFVNTINNHDDRTGIIFRDFGGTVAAGTYTLALTYVGTWTFDANSEFAATLNFWQVP